MEQRASPATVFLSDPAMKSEASLTCLFDRPFAVDFNCLTDYCFIAGNASLRVSWLMLTAKDVFASSAEGGIPALILAIAREKIERWFLVPENRAQLL